MPKDPTLEVLQNNLVVPLLKDLVRHAACHCTVNDVLLHPDRAELARIADRAREVMKLMEAIRITDQVLTEQKTGDARNELGLRPMSALKGVPTSAVVIYESYTRNGSTFLTKQKRRCRKSWTAAGWLYISEAATAPPLRLIKL